MCASAVPIISGGQTNGKPISTAIGTTINNKKPRQNYF